MTATKDKRKEGHENTKTRKNTFLLRATETSSSFAKPVPDDFVFFVFSCFRGLFLKTPDLTAADTPL